MSGDDEQNSDGEETRQSDARAKVSGSGDEASAESGESVAADRESVGSWLQLYDRASRENAERIAGLAGSGNEAIRQGGED